MTDGWFIFNELAAFLGFAIPSSVLWIVWQIRRSFLDTQKAVEKLSEDVAWLKRHQEDQDLVDDVKKGG